MTAPIHEDLAPVETNWQHGLSVLKPTSAELEKGLALHRELGVCENYGFLPKVYTPKLQEEIDALATRGLSQVEWKRTSRTYRVSLPARDTEARDAFFSLLKQSGIAGIIQSVNYLGETLEDVVSILSAYRHLCNVFKDRLLQATCAEDLDEARRTGRVGILFSLTGLPTSGAGSLSDLESVLDWVDVWYHLGVRFMHLGYNRRNWFADGCTEAYDGGVSDFGRELIARMNRAGIVIDVPHSSRQTVLHAARMSSRPIVATHIGCAAVHPHPRGKTDEEIKAIADSGGYVGICAVPSFLGDDASLLTFFRHLEHALKLVGEDHVAIGTDRGYGMARPASIRDYPAPLKRKIDPAGWNDANRPGAAATPPTPAHRGSLAWTNWPLITVGLVRMGLKEETIARLLGGNLRRTLRACRPEAEMAGH